MENQHLLTISQFAEFQGITPQAVYKQLNNKLKDCLIEVEGQKYIDIDKFEEIHHNQIKQPFNNKFNEVGNQSLIPLLEKQIEEKDKQIERLFQQIEEKDRQIETLQNLLNQSQQLQAIDRQLLLESNQKKKGFFGLLFSRKKEVEEK